MKFMSIHNMNNEFELPLYYEEFLSLMNFCIAYSEVIG